MMTQPGACAVCFKPVTNQTILTCCHNPCHVDCANHWKKSRYPYLECPKCSHGHLIYVIEVIQPQQWKEDPKFVEEVKRLWKHNTLWYGIFHGHDGPVEGFWGTLFDPNPCAMRTHFLGYTQSEVIQHMKNKQ